MNHSFKISFCGIMTALALLCMLIAPLIPVALYICTILSGLCIALAVEETDLKYGSGVYIAASILAFLMIPDKETAVAFSAIFGSFPLIKNFVEKKCGKLLNGKITMIVLKIIFINISCIVYFLITIYLLGVPKNSFSVGNIYLPWVFLAAGNVLCMMYDRFIELIIDAYKQRFRKKIFRKW